MRTIKQKKMLELIMLNKQGSESRTSLKKPMKKLSSTRGGAPFRCMASDRLSRECVCATATDWE